MATAVSSPLPTHSEVWREYFDEATLRRADALRREYKITSTGVMMHIDAYERPETDAPVFLFSHGGGGYSRIFVPLALELYDLGYTVVLPDQYGQGFTEGNRGDFHVSLFVQNLVDASNWAKRRYGGRLFIGGGSFGSIMSYMAAASGAPAEALVLHNLYDLGADGDALGLSRFAPLRQTPGVQALFRTSIAILARILPRFRIPFELIGDFRNMVDTPDFYPIWKRDPLPIRGVTLRYMHSLFTTTPAIPFEENRLPALVINPIRDRMTAPSLTKANYERLGGRKRYVEIEYGHWSTKESFAPEWAKHAHDFLQTV